MSALNRTIGSGERIKKFIGLPFLRALAVGVIDTLFPVFCLGCETPDEWLCADCRMRIPLSHEHRCPSCFAHITPSGRTCFACSEKYPLEGIFIASHYQVPLLARAIHAYKYRFLEKLSLQLGTFLSDALRQTDIPLPDFILPVPLHTRRLRFRGFNQSELLADVLAKMLTPGIEIPVLRDCLLRTRYTKPQMKTTSRQERLANLKGAFALNKGDRKKIKGKSLWLIDDVATTGTTLAECAKVLKKSGAKSVFGIALAR